MTDDLRATVERLKKDAEYFERIYLRHGSGGQEGSEADDYGRIAADLATAIKALEERAAVNPTEAGRRIRRIGEQRLMDATGTTSMTEAYAESERRERAAIDAMPLSMQVAAWHATRDGASNTPERLMDEASRIMHELQAERDAAIKERDAEGERIAEAVSKKLAHLDSDPNAGDGTDSADPADWIGAECTALVIKSQDERDAAREEAKQHALAGGRLGVFIGDLERNHLDGLTERDENDHSAERSIARSIEAVKKLRADHDAALARLREVEQALNTVRFIATLCGACGKRYKACACCRRKLTACGCAVAEGCSEACVVGRALLSPTSTKEPPPFPVQTLCGGCHQANCICAGTTKEPTALLGQTCETCRFAGPTYIFPMRDCNRPIAAPVNGQPRWVMPGQVPLTNAHGEPHGCNSWQPKEK